MNGFVSKSITYGYIAKDRGEFERFKRVLDIQKAEN